MLAARGLPGKDGKKGADGAPAAQVIETRCVFTKDLVEIISVYDNGDLMKADLTPVRDYLEKHVEGYAEEKIANIFEQMDTTLLELGTPIKVYRGWWSAETKYGIGDVVRSGKTFYICIGDVPRGSLDPEKWTIFGGGGSGAPGGGSSQSGLTAPKDQSYLQLVSWTPGTSNVIDPGTWIDGRTLIGIVDVPQELYDTSVLPKNQLVQGKLVYVRSEGLLYEYIVDPTTAAGTIDDWKPLVSGVTYVGRMGDLPTSAVNGQLFIVRMDMGGRTLNRLVTWRDVGNIDVSAVLSGSMPIPDGSSETLTVTFPSGATTAAENDDFVVEIGLDTGVAITRVITVLRGETPDDIASKIQTAFDVGAPEVAATVSGNVVTLAPSAGFAIDSFFTTASQTAGARGGWVFVNRENWMKALRSDPDQASDQQPGDLQITTEANGKELKVFENGAWQTVYSEDDVKAWIAAGSQFQGTVEESGHDVAGAVDLDALPAQTALSLGEKAHYWIWVGSPSHTIAANTIGGAASAIDGAALSVGDWIIVAETFSGSGVFEYRVIPGDLMSRTVARQMFSMQSWVQGAWPEDSVVVYQGDVYRAPQAITAQDPAPDDPASTWTKVNISGGLKVATDDGQLPPTAPTGQVWIILSSATYGGQALVAYDHAARNWEELGGGGQPLDFSQSVELIGVGSPVGSVIAYAGKTLPDGWLFVTVAVSRQQIIQSFMPHLGISTTLPDLRNHFIRGGESTGRPLIRTIKIQRGCRATFRSDCSRRQPPSLHSYNR